MRARSSASYLVPSLGLAALAFLALQPTPSTAAMAVTNNTTLELQRRASQWNAHRGLL